MKLSECGARTYDISTNLWSMKSRKKIELLKIILDRMEFSFNDKFVVSYVTLDDFKKLDSTKEHLEGLRRTDLMSDESYYTTEQVQQLYGLTSANICHIVRVHHISKVKVGVKNLLLKTDVERAMAERTAKGL